MSGYGILHYILFFIVKFLFERMMRDIFVTLHVACGTLTKYFPQIISNVNTLYDASIYYMVRGPRSYRRHQVNRSTSHKTFMVFKLI